LKIEYLLEYEFIFKTALAHKSGDSGVLFAEKTEGRKSREIVSLSVSRLAKSTVLQYDSSIYSLLWSNKCLLHYYKRFSESEAPDSATPVRIVMPEIQKLDLSSELICGAGAKS
jgi:hypothetical protein